MLTKVVGTETPSTRSSSDSSRSSGRSPLAMYAYPLATVRPLLFDERADVRRLAVAIAGEELERWGDRQLVYDLAASGFKEPRAHLI